MEYQLHQQKVQCRYHEKSLAATVVKQNCTIDADLLNDIKDFLVQGYVRDNDKKYGISLENIGKVVVNADETPITAAQITWLKNNLKTLGIKPRFETNDQFKKEGYAEEGE